MIAQVLQLTALALCGANEEMTQAESERERTIIAALEQGDARVREQNGGLIVGCARTEKLIDLAAQLVRMRGLVSSWYLDEPVLTGPELRHLHGHKGLRAVDVDGMPISGEHFEVFTSMPNLEILRCRPQGNVKAALEHIGKCRRLRILTLGYTQMADDDLELLNGLDGLEELELSHTPVSAGIRVVRNMPKLRELALEETLVADDGLQALGGLPNLVSLFIGSPNVTDTGLKWLAACKKLQTVSIKSDRITCRGAEVLAELKNVKSIYVSSTVPDAGLFKALATMPRLTHLDCSGEGLSDDDRINLCALLPKCDVDWREPKNERQLPPPPEEGPPKPKLDKTAPFPKLLAEASDNDLCDATFLKIGDRTVRRIAVSKYSPEERVVMLTWHAAGLIDNGGFEHLFSADFDGDPDFRLTAEAFNTAGHMLGYTAFQDAFRLFPEGQVPKQSAARSSLYEAQNSAARKAINVRFWKESANKSLEKNLAAYIRKNAAAFSGLK